MKTRLVCALAVLNAAVWLAAGNLVVWAPLWWHWRVSPPVVADVTVSAHRRVPDDTVLAFVADMSMTTDHPLAGAAAHAAARELMQGRFVWPDLPTLPIGPRFSPSDLSLGVPVQQIFTSSLIVPDILLRAHEHSPDPALVEAAWQYARGFIEHEEGLLLPRNYERNSHAVANRASVLARLWRHLRSSAAYDRDMGRSIHLHAQRIGALLAKPSNFIASTNHGVMQNIGLLQLSAAFPELPEAQAWTRLARRRLALQLPGWIGPEGAVLEHSAGYHFHGVVLSGYVARLLDHLDAHDEDWTLAHRRSLAFMYTLQRPDRSLPAYGNTFRYAWTLPRSLGEGDRGPRPPSDGPGFDRHYPVAGHVVWWSPGTAAGAQTHTHVPYGYFPGHGHRRAQELSLLVWAGGIDWSTNTGYWPSGDLQGIRITDGWEGGNGPHAVGESAEARRHSRVVGRASSDGLRFVDLERVSDEGPDGPLRVRRQVLQVRGSTWLVIDSHADPLKRPLRVIWTAAPELSQQRLSEDSFRLSRSTSPIEMRLRFSGSAGFSATPRRGSVDPFAGWVASDRKAHPAPAIDVRLPALEGASWMLATLQVIPGSTAPQSGDRRNGVGAEAEMHRFDGPDSWTIRWRDAGSATGDLSSISLEAGRMLVERSHPATGLRSIETLSLSSGESDDEALRRIAAARERLLAEFPRYRVGLWERRRASRALFGVWLLTTAVIGVAVWRWRPARRGGQAGHDPRGSGGTRH